MDSDNQTQFDELSSVKTEPLNKRYRQKFSADDKELFLRILKEHMHVIERKEGDVLTLKRKHAAWRTVLKTYNEGASSERDLHQLRLLWKRMKKVSSFSVQKEEQLTPEEFTVMVNPYDINTINVNQTESSKLSNIPTPSPDSSDCLDFTRNDDDDQDIKPLQIVLDPESPEPKKNHEDLQKQICTNNRLVKECDTKIIQIPECISIEPVRQKPKNSIHELSSYEKQLLALAEKEHLQKMLLLKKRKQNESLREELLRLKIKTQLLKQDKVRSENRCICALKDKEGLERNTVC